MPYSYQTTTASGSSNLVTVPFPYLDKSDVHVYLNGSEVDQNTLVWNSSSVIALPGGNPVSGTTVLVRRITPVASPVVVFVDGALAATDLNTSETWLMHAAQEQQDVNVGLNTLGQIDAGGKQIINVADPSTAQGAATQNSVTAQLSAGLATILSALPLSTGGASSNDIDVFFGFGQSNREGNGDSTLSPLVPTGMCLQYTTGGTLLDANDPIDSGGTYAAITGSFAPSFCLTYYASLGRKICYVPCAVGGTGLVAASYPGGNPNGDWSPTGALRGQMITRISAAMAKLRVAGYNPILRFGLWAQGESDATNGGGGGVAGGLITGADYQAGLTGLFNFVWGATIDGKTFPELPLFVSVLGAPYNDPTNAAYTTIREAQVSAVQALPYADFSFMEAKDFNALGLMNPALSPHYSQRGYNYMGRMEALAVINRLTNLWGVVVQSSQTSPTHIYNNTGQLTVGGAPGSGSGGATSPDALNAYNIQHGECALGAFGAQPVGTRNTVLRLANVNGNGGSIGSLVELIAQPDYISLGDTYGGVIRFQHDQNTGATNIILGGYPGGNFVERGRWGNSGGLVIGSTATHDAHGGSPYGDGVLSTAKSVASGTDNALLVMENTFGSPTAGQVVSLKGRPGAGALDNTYGGELQFIHDGDTGRTNIAFGGNDAGVWLEFGRFTHTGGLAVGTTTDPGQGNVLAGNGTFTKSIGAGTATAPSTAGSAALSGFLNLLPMTAPATPASGWVLYVDSGDSSKLKVKASTGTVTTLATP